MNTDRGEHLMVTGDHRRTVLDLVTIGRHARDVLDEAHGVPA